MIDERSFNELMNQFTEWWAFGTPTIKHVFTDMHGDLEEEQWLWIAYYDDLNIPKFRGVGNSISEAVQKSLSLVLAEDRKKWSDIREEDREVTK